MKKEIIMRSNSFLAPSVMQHNSDEKFIHFLYTKWGWRFFYDYVICPMLHFSLSFRYCTIKTFLRSPCSCRQWLRAIIVQTRGFCKLRTKLLLRFAIFMVMWVKNFVCVWVWMVKMKMNEDNLENFLCYSFFFVWEKLFEMNY